MPTTPSGLHYEDEVEGTGTRPQRGQTAVVHYTGWLTDGTKFDSSRDRGQPFSFVVGRGQVIKGWDEGVTTMKIGGKRRLTLRRIWVMERAALEVLSRRTPLSSLMSSCLRCVSTPPR